MKSILMVSLLVISSVSSANSSFCKEEGQIIASVKSIVEKTATGCVVSVDNVKMYNESQVCALVLEEVISTGVKISLKNDQCSLQVGEMLSGVLFKDESDTVTLEQY